MRERRAPLLQGCGPPGFLDVPQGEIQQLSRCLVPWVVPARPTVDSARPPVLVVDIRNNTGGNNYRNVPLMDGIAARPAYRIRGALYVITGRATFSAGADVGRRLAHVAEPIFVGERSRGDPRQSGNVERLTLPHSGLRVDYGEQHEIVGSGTSPYLPLDVEAPPTFASTIAGRDAAIDVAIEAVLQAMARR